MTPKNIGFTDPGESACRQRQALEKTNRLISGKPLVI
jgi:hypothetical protein